MASQHSPETTPYRQHDYLMVEQIRPWRWRAERLAENFMGPGNHQNQYIAHDVARFFDNFPFVFFERRKNAAALEEPYTDINDILHDHISLHGAHGPESNFSFVVTNVSQVVAALHSAQLTSYSRSGQKTRLKSGWRKSAVHSLNRPIVYADTLAHVIERSQDFDFYSAFDSEHAAQPVEFGQDVIARLTGKVAVTAQQLDVQLSHIDFSVL